MGTYYNKLLKLLLAYFFLISFNCYSQLTTRTWTGATNSDFNTSTNWSPNAVPSSGDSCVISVSADVTITLSGSITVGALYLAVTGSNNSLRLDAVSYLLTINGNLHMKASTGNTNTDVTLDCGSSAGGVTVGRHAFFDDGGDRDAWVVADASSPGFLTLKGNATIGTNAQTSPTVEPDITFDGTGTQTVTVNNSVSYFLAEDLVIGNSNNPTVNLTGSDVDGFGCYNGTVTLNGTSILNIGTRTINRIAGTGGSFTMASASTLKIGGTNTFPSAYSTYTLNSASYTYYDGTNQTVSSKTYGNLYLEGSGTKTISSTATINGSLNLSGTASLDANAAMDINGGVTIGNGTTLLAGSATSTVAGNWTNNGTFTKETSTINFDKAGDQTIAGDNSTTFNNLTVSSSGIKAFNIATTVSSATSISGTSTFDANAAMNFDGAVTINANTTFDAGSYTHTAAGNWTDDGTFTEGTSTMNFDGTGSQTISGSSVNFYNFTKSGSGTTTLGASVDVNNNVSLSAGTWAQSSYDINVASNWSSTGNYFSKGSGTVTFDGSGTSNVSNSGTSSATLFSESFENGGAIPSGWSTTIVNDPGTDPALTYVTSSTYPSGFSATDGSYFVRFNSFSAPANAKIRLYKTASISTVGKTGLAVNFDWSRDNDYSTKDDRVMIQYSTNGSSWTDVSSVSRFSASGDAWSSQSISLPVGTENQSTLYIGFLFISEYGNDCHLDNVVVTEAYSGEAFNKIAISKSGAGSVNLTSKVLSQTSFTFTSGIVTSTSTEFLEFDEDATVAGTASNTCHVNGYVQKRSNTTDKFTFPVGDGSAYRSIAVTPSNTNATTWTAKYFTNGYSDFTVTGVVNHVSQLEYWDLSRSGSANASIELSWDANSYADENYTELVVAHYNGADWESAGGNSHIGSASSGTLVSDAGWSTFSPFTLGSTTVNNPLPVTLLSFDAEANGEAVNLNWSTSAEINNDYFTVEKSLDGVYFEFVSEVNGAGNSNQIILYSSIDPSPYSGTSYYRLKQTDFDGQFSYSDIEQINIGEAISFEFNVFPNPLPSDQAIKIKIRSEENQMVTIKIVDFLGKIYFNGEYQMSESEEILNIASNNNLSKGMYLVTCTINDNVYSQKLVVK